MKLASGIAGIDLSAALLPLLYETSPPSFLTHGMSLRRSQFEGMPVRTLTPTNPSGKYVVAVHGGSFVAEPLIVHWIEYTRIARRTDATVTVPIYPLTTNPANPCLSPGNGGTAAQVVPMIADLISSVIAEHGSQNVSLAGDSAGGNIALAAAQLLVRRGDPTPSRMVLISPELDPLLSNPAIDDIYDPLLSKQTLLDAGRLWQGNLDPNDPLFAPLYGSLGGLPPTTVYSGSRDLLSADVLVLQKRALAENANIDFVLRSGEVHGWPTLFFLPEAIATQPQIYQQLGLVDQSG